MIHLIFIIPLYSKTTIEADSALKSVVIISITDKTSAKNFPKLAVYQAATLKDFYFELFHSRIHEI